MSTFKVSKTSVASMLSYPVTAGRYNPTVTATNLLGEIQFSNINVLSAFFNQINEVFSISLRLSADISAPLGELSGDLIVSSPSDVTFYDTNSIVGVITTSQVGVFGNSSIVGTDISVNVTNVAGPLSLTGAVLQVLISFNTITHV